MLIDRLVAGRGAVKEQLDLAGERIAARRYGADRREIVRIGRIVARDRLIGECEAVAAERAEWCIELLVHIGQRQEMLLLLAQAVRTRALVDVFDENA